MDSAQRKGARLEIPVARHAAAQYRIMQYYRDVYDGLSCKFGADPRFDGVMAKNPLHPPAGCTVDWIRREPYSLTELREWLPAKLPKPVLTTGVGRNCDLFSHCVKLAHQPQWARIIAAEGHAGRWLAHVRQPELRRVRGGPPSGLGMPEHRQVVRQVLPAQLQRRAVQRNPNGANNPALAPRRARLLLPGPGAYGRIDDRAGLQPSRPGADLRDLGTDRPPRPSHLSRTGEVESRRIRPDIP